MRRGRKGEDGGGMTVRRIVVRSYDNERAVMTRIDAPRSQPLAGMQLGLLSHDFLHGLFQLPNLSVPNQSLPVAGYILQFLQRRMMIPSLIVKIQRKTGSGRRAG
jgi:hypothetical protein